MCGTAEPGTPDFARVDLLERAHLAGDQRRTVPRVDVPRRGQVRDAGQEPCQDAGAAAADDSLDYRWGYEWPTREQWDAGQHYGRCWAPD